MFKLVRSAMVLGAMFAMAGFSYSLATSADGRKAKTTGTPHVGTNPRGGLRFITPFFQSSTDRDLGDAAFGSQIVRFVRARGGVGPKRYTSDTGNSNFKGQATLAAAVAPFTGSAINLLETGRLTGNVGTPTTTVQSLPAPVRFDVTAFDSSSVLTPKNITETFRLQMVDSSSFKFAQSALNNAVQFRDYFEFVQVIAGNAPYAFSVTSVVLKDATTGATDTTVTKLSDVGLFLNAKTGELNGRPLKAGVLSIGVSCVDRNGAGVQALSRDKSAFGQTITVLIEASNSIVSDLFATAITIKGDSKKPGKDSVSYTGLINVATTDVTGKTLTLTIAGFSSGPLTVGAKGGATITPTGQIKIAIKNTTFDVTNFGGLNNTTANLPVRVTIVDPATNKTLFDANELLRFSIKAKNGSTKFTATYKFGPNNLGGGFFITGVAGKDSKDGKGDAWKAAFQFVPPSTAKLDAVGNVSVGIGTDFTDTFGVVSAKGKVAIAESRDKNAAGVFQFNFGAGGKGALTTGPLPTVSTTQNQATAIPTGASAGGKRDRFTLFVEFGDTNSTNPKGLFGAESGVNIFPTKNGWTTKGSKK